LEPHRLPSEEEPDRIEIAAASISVRFPARQRWKTILVEKYEARALIEDPCSPLKPSK